MWTESSALAIAAPRCQTCAGSGLRILRAAQIVPCNCVLRAVFRSCLGAFRGLILDEGIQWRRAWDRRTENYLADFYLISKRSLTEDEFRILRFHHFLGADWRLCSRRLNMDRGTFFHSLYRIERKLGKAFAETVPYALYPFRDYMANPPRGKVVSITTNCRVGRVTRAHLVVPIRPAAAA